MGELKLFIAGGSKGESIVIKTPDEKWGVVDCYSPDPSDRSKNICWRLLKDKRVMGVDVKDLEFVCLTHPHDDHFMGLSNLLEDFHVEEFWRFGGLTTFDLERLLAIVSAQAHVSADRDARKGSMELHRVFDEVRGPKKIREVELTTKTLLRRTADYEIWAIAPPSDLVSKYREETLSRFGELDPKAIRMLKHNTISAALLIKFGTTQVVLGGDVERSGWTIIVPELERNRFSLGCHAVKVSHHGSSTGYTPELWSLFCQNCQPCAVITPFLQHGLPRAEGLEHILSHTPHTYTVSRKSVVGGGFVFNKDTELEIQLLHRSFWSTYFTAETEWTGVCILSFDREGNQVQPVSLMGDAARVSI